jgi:hypothetical protein
MTSFRSPLFSSPARREAAGWAALWWVAVTLAGLRTTCARTGMAGLEMPISGRIQSMGVVPPRDRVRFKEPRNP